MRGGMKAFVARGRCRGAQILTVSAAHRKKRREIEGLSIQLVEQTLRVVGAVITNDFLGVAHVDHVHVPADTA